VKPTTAFRNLCRDFRVRFSPTLEIVAAEVVMPFSLTSYLLGVGTVVGALAFGLGGGVLVTNTAVTETPAGRAKVERPGAELAARPQAANSQENPARPVQPAQDVAPGPVPAAQADQPRPDPPREMQAVNEPQPTKQTEPPKQTEQRQVEQKPAQRKIDRQKRYAERKTREIASARTTPRKWKGRNETEPPEFAFEREEPHFDRFRPLGPPLLGRWGDMAAPIDGDD
jgi:outer membrane biosynthesis protein TonB